MLTQQISGTFARITVFAMIKTGGSGEKYQRFMEIGNVKVNWKGRICSQSNAMLANWRKGRE